mmetsp:Transcript_20264/g.19941  ORF Transcript_20264/g.19941 Transcript_20264/m.19941 type:complete len:276 (-) Transcript_20264:85-912(-)
MNTINLLNKLELPMKIGQDGQNLLYQKKTIMEAYLSASSLEFNRQLFGIDNSTEKMSLLFSKENIVAEATLSPDFDLFQRFTPEIDYSMKMPNFSDLTPVFNLSKSDDVKPLAQINLEGASQEDTELDSYTKIENKYEEEKKQKSKKGKRKVEKNNIEEFVAEERRRLLKKLETGENRIIFKRRVKNIKKDPKISAYNYRGSKYWGVSKNKSKWQVMITLNHFKEYQGGFESEEAAARMYDKKSICTFGLKAKINFDYTRDEVLSILSEDESIIM